MLRYLGGLGVLFFAWLVPVTFSHAGLVFEFAVGGAPKTSINIAGVGQTVDIQVYLRQTDGESILTEEGLSTAGIKVTFDNPAVAAVSTVGDIHENPLFDDSILFAKAVTGTTAELNQAVDFSSQIVFPTLSDPDRIWLGTFTFTGLALGSTTISVTDLDPTELAYEVITGEWTPLDDFITPGSATLTVTPEPGSVALSLLMIGAASVVTSCRRRRRRSVQAAEEACPAGEVSL
jgi:hypothetical protein